VRTVNAGATNNITNVTDNFPALRVSIYIVTDRDGKMSTRHSPKLNSMFSRHLRDREVLRESRRDFVQVCLFTARKVAKVGIVIPAFLYFVTLVVGLRDEN